MPAPDWENLDEFLDDDEFADQVEIETQSGASFSFSAIFDNPYLNAALGEYDFDTASPRITCKESDVVTVERGDIARISGRAYDVLTGPQSDGTGMAVLDLAPAR